MDQEVIAATARGIVQVIIYSVLDYRIYFFKLVLINFIKMFQQQIHTILMNKCIKG